MGKKSKNRLDLKLRVEKPMLIPELIGKQAIDGDLKKLASSIKPLQDKECAESLLWFSWLLECCYRNLVWPPWLSIFCCISGRRIVGLSKLDLYSLQAVAA